MNLELVGALEELEKERGISKDILLEAIEFAIVSAYKRDYGANGQNVSVSIDERTGNIKVYAYKRVVETVENRAEEISLEDARDIDPSLELDDSVEVEVTPRDFGRIAAQTAKQVVIQRIREAERALVYEEYSNRVGDIVTGVVSRREHRNVMVELGKVEAVLPPGDQMPGDDYSPGTRLKLYIVDVKEHTKGPQVIISRTHPMLLARLFELEVPEIYSGVVEIMGVAREAGVRSKISVMSHSENVDPVGACVGPRGVRVQAVVKELKGEKVDIIAYSDNPEEYVANALSPARVNRVIVDEEGKSARVVVPDNQLSLSIGKEGQNARLAARLTGWRIDIKSEEQMAQIIAEEAFQRAVPEEEDEEPVAAGSDAQWEATEEEAVEAESPAVEDSWEEVGEKVREPETEDIDDVEEIETVEPDTEEPEDEEPPVSQRLEEIDYSGLDRIEAFKLRLLKAQQEQAARKQQEKADKDRKAAKEENKGTVLHDLSSLKAFFEDDEEE
ncbi:MAG: transcription termination/antitermination protein NusA [Firmicutes bacterium]|nr:transcription termination/antitermination protein NusA [Bacillota bacterium]